MLLPILTGTILSKNYDSQLKPNLSSKRFREKVEFDRPGERSPE